MAQFSTEANKGAYVSKIVMKRKILPVLLLAGLAVSCGGQKQKGSPNDPNEQQGNPQAQPANSITSKSNKEPSDNKAGRNAHTQLQDGQDNK